MLGRQLQNFLFCVLLLGVVVMPGRRVDASLQIDRPADITEQAVFVAVDGSSDAPPAAVEQPTQTAKPEKTDPPAQPPAPSRRHLTLIIGLGIIIVGRFLIRLRR